MTPSPSSPINSTDLKEQIDDIVGDARNDAYQAGGNDTNMDLRDYTGEIMDLVTAYTDAIQTEATKHVNRLEVIDEEGRAYVKGPMYSSGPVGVELSYQDDGKTLKVFVEHRLATLRKEGA